MELLKLLIFWICIIILYYQHTEAKEGKKIGCLSTVIIVIAILTVLMLLGDFLGRGYDPDSIENMPIRR